MRRNLSDSSKLTWPWSALPGTTAPQPPDRDQAVRPINDPVCYHCELVLSHVNPFVVFCAAAAVVAVVTAQC